LLQFLVAILHLGFGSVDPHIFPDLDLDLDLGSQYVADPTDPDPKHPVSTRNVFNS